MDKECVCLWCKKGEVGANAELLSVITRFGFGVVPVIGSNPQLTFTIGLMHSYRHPELILFGLPANIAHQILNLCGAYIRDHGPLESGRRYTEFANLPTIFRNTHHRRTEQYVFRCTEFYGGQQPPFMQVVWPDPRGKFPWEPRFDHNFNGCQPKLWLGVPQLVK